MKTKKSSIRARSFSLLLCLSMLVTLCIPAFAAEPASGENKTESEMTTLDARIAQESKAYKKVEYDSIHKQLYAQLKEQNALHLLPEMQDMIYSSVEKEIDAFVARKYGRSSLTQNAIQAGNYYVYAPGGVSLEYAEYDSSYDLECAISCFDYEDTNELVWQQLTTFTLSDALLTVLGYIPAVGSIFGALSYITTITNTSAWQDVDNAGRLAKIMNTKSYDHFDGTTVHLSVLSGWWSYPYLDWPSDVDSYNYTYH